MLEDTEKGRWQLLGWALLSTVVFLGIIFGAALFPFTAKILFGTLRYNDSIVLG